MIVNQYDFPVSLLKPFGIIHVMCGYIPVTDG